MSFYVNLWMDDCRPCPHVGWVVATTVAEAKRILENEVVMDASFDHDMGACEECIKELKHIGDMKTPETTFYNRCPHAEDGTSLVNWMEETGNWPLEEPTVHSANPVGAERMRKAIRRHYRD